MLDLRHRIHDTSCFLGMFHGCIHLGSICIGIGWFFTNTLCTFVKFFLDIIYKRGFVGWEWNFTLDDLGWIAVSWTVKCFIGLGTWTHDGTLHTQADEGTLAVGITDEGGRATSRGADGSFKFASDDGRNLCRCRQFDSSREHGLDALIVGKENNDVFHIGTKHESKSDTRNTDGDGVGPGPIQVASHKDSRSDAATKDHPSLDSGHDTNTGACHEVPFRNSSNAGTQSIRENHVGIANHAFHTGQAGGSFGRFFAHVAVWCKYVGNALV
mmetsp:Transcript_21701/g.40517  ORF Transcript_21701/g.40517 Transcript_21701/m.40517 type:complete len:270 (+) Transcript_21701:274-1083(+)